MKAVSSWKPEDQRSWEELERRAAAQARELYARRREFQTQEPPQEAGTAPETWDPPEPPEPPPAGVSFQEGEEASVSKASGSREPPSSREEFPPPLQQGTAPRETSAPGTMAQGRSHQRAAASPQVPVSRGGYSQGSLLQPRQGGMGLAGDQLLLLALLWLLVEEKADTQLILAVAYILLL